MKTAAARLWMVAAVMAAILWACHESAGGGSTEPAVTATGPTPLEFTRFSQQPWSLLTGNGWNYLRRGSSKHDGIVMDRTAPTSPPFVLRIVFTPDMGHDREPSVHWVALPTVREIYTAWWIKLSANWSPSPAGGGKMTFLHAAPDGHGQVYMSLHGSSAPHWVIVNTEWAPYGQRIWQPNVAKSEIRYGRWYRVTWHMKWPSPSSGRNEGTVRWWVDDVLNGAYTNVVFPDGGAGFHQFEFAPTLQNPPPAEQYMYIDHTTINVP